MVKIPTLIASICVFACGFLCPSIRANTITGSVAFGGTATASGPSGNGVTTVSFLPGWSVVKTAGDYVPVSIGTPTTFNGFSFTGDGIGAVLTAPVLPQWSFSFGGLSYSFDLTSLTNGHTEAGAMSFTGIGVAHITGFTDTVASWSLAGTGSGFIFRASFGTTSTAAPESGSTAILLGLALVGIEGLRQTLRRAKS